jgi:hypothetical protein
MQYLQNALSSKLDKNEDPPENQLPVYIGIIREREKDSETAVSKQN